MKFIEINPLENGAHRNQQIDGEIETPDGWARVPADIEYPEAFPFVNLSVADGVVTAMEVNQDAYDAYLAQSGSADVDAAKAARSAAIKAACETAIVGGFDADVLGRGVLHYTLTQIQQRDLEALMLSITGGASAVLWHDASRVTHEVYTAAQFTALYQAGYAHMIGCKLRSDWLEQYVMDLCDNGDLEAAKAVSWETELPESYQQSMDGQLAMMLGDGNA